MPSIDEVGQIVAQKKWDSLIGQTEGQSFDAKKAGYRLDDDRQCEELAKDVSSFANAEGGYILLGVETKPSTTHPADEVVALRPFPQKYLDAARYYAAIREWVSPDIDGLNVEWVPEKEHGAQGFGVITIPPQQEERKWFLLVRTIQDDGRRRGTLVGLFERKRDVSQPTDPDEIVLLLRDGRNYRSRVGSEIAEVRAHLARIEQGMVDASKPTPPALTLAEVNTRIEGALGATGLAQRPHYVLAAWPTPVSELTTIQGTGEGTITGLLERPPVLRYAGWSLETLDHAVGMQEGKYRQLANGDRKVLRLYRDGMLVHAVSAGSDFLGWGDPKQYHAKPRILSLAIIEVTYLFCRFYAEVLRDLREPVDKVTIAIRLGRLRSATEAPVRLSAHPPGNAFAFLEAQDRHPALADTYDHEVTIDAKDFNPAVAAYQVVSEIFMWFGIEADLIPYIDNVAGVRVVSEQKIINSGK